MFPDRRSSSTPSKCSLHLLISSSCDFVIRPSVFLNERVCGFVSPESSFTIRYRVLESPPSPCVLRLHCLSQDVLTFVIAAFLFYLLVLFLVFCSGHLVPSALLPCLLHPLFTFYPFIDCVPRVFRNSSLFSVSSFEPQDLLARLYDRISPPFPDCIHILAVFSPGGLFFVLSDFK